MQRRATGITALDKHLNGGVPPGALLLLTSHSQTPVELFTHTILAAHTDTRTAYITTTSTTDTTAAELQKTPVSISPNDTTIHSINPDDTVNSIKNTIQNTAQANATRAQPGENTTTTHPDTRHDETTPPPTTDGGTRPTGTPPIIIIDTITDLEHGTGRREFQAFLTWLQDLQRHTGSTVLLTRYTDAHTATPTHEHVTNRAADAIWKLTEQQDDTNISTYLYMPKCRFAPRFDERWKIDIDTEIRIDTSRDIA